MGIARELVRCGARVAVTARRADDLARADDGLGVGGQAIGRDRREQGDPEHRRDAVAQVIERFGRLDLLVNNAGTNPQDGPPVELAPGARMNAIAPGVVKTRFARALWEGREEQAAAAYPLGRLGTPPTLRRSPVSVVRGGLVNHGRDRGRRWRRDRSRDGLMPDNGLR